MTDGDLGAFTEEVRRVATIFRFRASPLELTQVTHAYFKAFRSRALSAVIAGADAWITKGQRFPKPFEWLEAMPRPGAKPANVPTLNQDEAEEWYRAERLGWEDAPCACVVCTAAGVTDKPLRFVPEVDEHDRDRKVYEPIRSRTVTAGHWAHGEELVRWYVAKEKFFREFRALSARGSVRVPGTKKQRFYDRIEDIFRPRPRLVEREPGEEG